MAGFWNGVFLGYCGNCAYFNYNYSRGLGFLSIGREIPPEYFREETRDIFAKRSAMNTYLKGVKLSDIGDPELYNSMIEYEGDEDLLNFFKPDTYDRYAMLLSEELPVKTKVCEKDDMEYFESGEKIYIREEELEEYDSPTPRKTSWQDEHIEWDSEKDYVCDWYVSKNHVDENKKLQQKNTKQELKCSKI